MKEDLARSIPFRQTIIREVDFGREQHEEPLTEVSRGRDKQLTGTARLPQDWGWPFVQFRTKG